MGSVWIPGSYQGDFARNYAREGLEISDMVAEAVAGTLEAAGVDAEDVAYMFSQLADEYDRRYGLNDAHLHAIAELNMRNARSNPLAQTRGVGHPVGATGVRMLHDAARQVTGQAGDCQVDGARTFATLNIGGSLTTTVSFVVTSE
jgi:acetyl-CoA acetyltransferase